MDMPRTRRAQMLRHKPQGRALESQNWRPGPATAAIRVKNFATPSWHDAKSSKISSPDTVSQDGQLSSIEGKQPILIAGTRLVLQMTGGMAVLVPDSEMAKHILKAEKIALAKERSQRIKKRQESDASRKPIDTLYIGNLPAVLFGDEDPGHDRAEVHAEYERLLTAELHERFATQPGFRRGLVKLHDGTPQALVQFNTIEDAMRAKENLDGKHLHFLKTIGRRGGMRLSYARNPICVGTSYKKSPIGVWEARAESKRQAQVQQSGMYTIAFCHYAKTNLGQQLLQQPPKKLSAAAAAFAPEQPLFVVPDKKSHAVEIRPDHKKPNDWISPPQIVQPQTPTPDPQSSVDSVLAASDDDNNHSRDNSNYPSTFEAISPSSALTEDQIMTMETMQCRNCQEQSETLPSNGICQKCESFRVIKPQVSRQVKFPSLEAFEAELHRMHNEASKATSSSLSLTEENICKKESLPCLNCGRPREHAGYPLCGECDLFWVMSGRLPGKEERA